MGSRDPIAKSGKSKRTSSQKRSSSPKQMSSAKAPKRTARSKRTKIADQPLDQVLLNASRADVESLSLQLMETPNRDDLVDALALRLGRGVLLRAESIRASLSEAIGGIVSVKSLAMARSKKAKAKAKPKLAAKKKAKIKSRARTAQKKAMGAR
jgi:hypothetical protein